MEYVPLWERDARKEGVTIGRKEGVKEEKKATAKNLLEMGLDIEKISKATGLKKSEIEKLAPTSH